MREVDSFTVIVNAAYCVCSKVLSLTIMDRLPVSMLQERNP